MKTKNWILILLLLGAVVMVALGVDTGAKATADDAPAKSDTPAVTTVARYTDHYDALTHVDIPKDIPSQMLHYKGFDVNFNPKMHQPNYAVWVLMPEESEGPYSRKDADFAPDLSVKGCATLADYKGSGYDRGHMAPAADMKWSHQAMADCHYLTNMSPQHNKLNSGAWATVEKNARKWTALHGPLVIVAGPVLTDRLTRTIGKSKIPVPERFFKVILAPEANPPMGIGFLMPNGYVEGGAQSTVVSIDRVEEVTGYDFFADLDDDTENAVESQASLRAWNH